jgi:hypothetical protein
MSEPKREPHPANAPGDFYVENEICITCMAPHDAAPELMGMQPEGHCYFKKQPSTPEELTHAIEAVRSSCVAGLRYAGNDPEVLERLRAKGCAAECDALSPGGDI